jgi:hypothetical protein
MFDPENAGGGRNFVFCLEFATTVAVAGNRRQHVRIHDKSSSHWSDDWKIIRSPWHNYIVRIRSGFRTFGLDINLLMALRLGVCIRYDIDVQVLPTSKNIMKALLREGNAVVDE